VRLTTIEEALVSVCSLRDQFSGVGGGGGIGCNGWKAR